LRKLYLLISSNFCRETILQILQWVCAKYCNR